MAITLEQIPPLPAVAMNVLKMDPNDPEASIDRLVNMITPDKGISAQLLKISNSALYGRSGRIKTLKDAVTLLGLKSAKNLVLMLSTKNLSGKLKDKIYVKYLNEFPVIAALISLDLCGPAQQNAIKEEVFLAGLLHKIGMAVIALNKPDHYSVILGFSESQNDDLLQLEKESYQTNHLEVGRNVFEVWKVPETLQQVVDKQDFDPGAVGELSDLTRITLLGGAIASRLLGIPGPVVNGEREQALVSHYGLTEEQMAVFGADYLANLKEHPFYQQAVAG